MDKFFKSSPTPASRKEEKMKYLFFLLIAVLIIYLINEIRTNEYPSINDIEVEQKVEKLLKKAERKRR